MSRGIILQTYKVQQQFIIHLVSKRHPDTVSLIKFGGTEQFVVYEREKCFRNHDRNKYNNIIVVMIGIQWTYTCD